MDILLLHYNITNKDHINTVVTLPLHFFFQEEQYDHLDEADVTKVDKLASDAMIWMNSAMNQQSKQSLTVDPSVKVNDIRAKTRVRVFAWYQHTELQKSNRIPNAGLLKWNWIDFDIVKFNMLLVVVDTNKLLYTDVNANVLVNISHPYLAWFVQQYSAVIVPWNW